MTAKRKEECKALKSVDQKPHVMHAANDNQPYYRYEEHKADIDALNLSPEEGQALLESLWQIMNTFAQVGYGVSNVQRFLPEVFEEKSAADSNDKNSNIVQFKPSHQNIESKE